MGYPHQAVVLGGFLHLVADARVEADGLLQVLDRVDRTGAGERFFERAAVLG